MKFNDEHNNRLIYDYCMQKISIVIMKLSRIFAHVDNSICLYHSIVVVVVMEIEADAGYCEGRFLFFIAKYYYTSRLGIRPLTFNILFLRLTFPQDRVGRSACK